MRRALTIAFAIPTLLTASCSHAPRLKLPVGPPKPTPTWTADDFECGEEPSVPPQDTTKAVAEGYQTDTLAWGRGCQTKLKARGADARRYDLIPSKKAKPK
jgi:hypothetical protein